MRILFTSDAFHPSIGGLQTASATVAGGLRERGHDVTLVTRTRGPAVSFPFTVVRRPSPSALLQLFKQADVVWQNQISLRLLWPAALVRRPLIVMHHAVLTNSAEAEAKARVATTVPPRAAVMSFFTGVSHQE